jgi:uridine kinase
VIDEVLRDAAGRPAANGVRIVGVDGPSGSGKTTFARALAGAAGAPLVHCDDFVSWHDFAGWWPRFEAEVLAPLLAGRDATYRVRDWDGDELGDSLKGTKTTPAAPLVVVEGVTCTRRGSPVTYAVWVEAPYDVRLARGIERDGESHRELWLRWMEEEATFFAADGTRERADLVLVTA